MHPADPDSPATTDHTHTHQPGTAPRRRLRRALTGTTVAALAVGALSGAVAADRGEPDAAAAALAAAATKQQTADLGDLGDLGDRSGSTTSRSARGPVDPAKAALVTSATTSGGQVTRTEKVDPVEVAVASGDPKTIARSMLGRFGFGADQFGCLESLWEKESGWDPHAANPTSSAYGIPQALPGSKMASAGADWQSNAATQIEWGLGYIRDTYGSPCSAWGHSQANGWY